MKDSFEHLQSADGNYSSGTPRNILAKAYVYPDFQWSINKGYNQTNVTLQLNLSGQTNINSTVNEKRGSLNDSRNDFWISYFVFGYQPSKTNDFDGQIGGLFEGPTTGETPAIVCDCLNSSVCPSGRTACSTVPQGGVGTVIYLETSRDFTKFWSSPPSPLTSKMLNEVQTTTSHELGHQFGLKGDIASREFKIMDYVNPISDPTGIVDVEFHPEHVNLIRRRIKSPGQV